MEGFARLISAGNGDIEIVPDIQRKKFAKNLWYKNLHRQDTSLQMLISNRNLSFAAYATLLRLPCFAFFWEEIESTQKIRPSLIKILQGERSAGELRAVLLIGCLCLVEAIVVARALGYSEQAVPSSLVESTIEDTGGLHRPGTTSTHKPSMLVDIETKRPLEIEAIMGEVIRLGKTHHVEMPVSF